MIFNSLDIELYVMAFEVGGISPYQFYNVDTLKLPSSSLSYTTIEETLDNLLSFKVKCSIYNKLRNVWLIIIILTHRR
jgi:hypothetical protein